MEKFSCTIEERLLEQNEINVVQSLDVEQEQTFENNDLQIVLYNPPSNSDDNIGYGKEIVPVPKPVSDTLVLPAVGAFTVQCAACFKWRFIPSKEKYQEIREHIMDQPFTCEIAREWRDGVSCDDPGDIEQDGSLLWAIDKPSIAQPPPGWDRELRIRSEGGANFADVYYTSPKGKKLRSIVDVNKYLMKHPEYIEQGITLSQFSFKKAKPLQENYVRKSTARSNTSSGEPVKVKKRSRPSKKHKSSSNTMDNEAPMLEIEGPLPTPNGLKDLMHNEPHMLRIEGPFAPPNVLYDSMHNEAHMSENEGLLIPPTGLNSLMHNEAHMLRLEGPLPSLPGLYDSVHNEAHILRIEGPLPPPNGLYDLMQNEAHMFEIEGPFPPPDDLYDI